MQLREALSQISEIRQQMAQAQVFRGYRSATTAATALVAVLAALAPARWAVTFSLGVFASRRFLPRSIVFVAGYYLLAGLVCLTLDRKTAALSPWTMGVVFGAGQLLTAGLLYWSLERGFAERNHGDG